MGFITKILPKLTGAEQQANAMRDAAATQAQAAQSGINQQQQMLEAFQKVLSPYVTAGNGALTAQQDLLGLNGSGAQSTAITGIQSSPQFQAMQQQGNDAILANASATGGLRGGNVQAALGQFSPALLSQLIQQQYGNLSGLTQIGQASAAGVGAAGLNTGANIANLLQQQGAATAGGQIAQGSLARQNFGDLMSIGGLLVGAGGLSGGFPGGLPGGAATGATAARAATSAGQVNLPGLGSSLYSTPSSVANYAPATSLPNFEIPFLSKF